MGVLPRLFKGVGGAFRSLYRDISGQLKTPLGARIPPVPPGMGRALRAVGRVGPALGKISAPAISPRRLGALKVPTPSLPAMPRPAGLLGRIGAGIRGGVGRIGGAIAGGVGRLRARLPAPTVVPPELAAARKEFDAYYQSIGKDAKVMRAVVKEVEQETTDAIKQEAAERIAVTKATQKEAIAEARKFAEQQIEIARALEKIQIDEIRRAHAIKVADLQATARQATDIARERYDAHVAIIRQTAREERAQRDKERQETLGGLQQKRDLAIMAAEAERDKVIAAIKLEAAQEKAARQATLEDLKAKVAEHKALIEQRTSAEVSVAKRIAAQVREQARKALPTLELEKWQAAAAAGPEALIQQIKKAGSATKEVGEGATVTMQQSAKSLFALADQIEAAGAQIREAEKAPLAVGARGRPAAVTMARAQDILKERTRQNRELDALDKERIGREVAAAKTGFKQQKAIINQEYAAQVASITEHYRVLEQLAQQKVNAAIASEKKARQKVLQEIIAAKNQDIQKARETRDQKIAIAKDATKQQINEARLLKNQKIAEAEATTKQAVQAAEEDRDKQIAIVRDFVNQYLSEIVKAVPGVERLRKAQDLLKAALRRSWTALSKTATLVRNLRTVWYMLTGPLRWVQGLFFSLRTAMLGIGIGWLIKQAVEAGSVLNRLRAQITGLFRATEDAATASAHASEVLGKLRIAAFGLPFTFESIAEAYTKMATIPAEMNMGKMLRTAFVLATMSAEGFEAGLDRASYAIRRVALGSPRANQSLMALGTSLIEVQNYAMELGKRWEALSPEEQLTTLADFVEHRFGPIMEEMQITLASVIEDIKDLFNTLGSYLAGVDIAGKMIPSGFAQVLYERFNKYVRKPLMYAMYTLVEEKEAKGPFAGLVTGMAKASQEIGRITDIAIKHVIALGLELSKPEIVAKFKKMWTDLKAWWSKFWPDLRKSIVKFVQDIRNIWKNFTNMAKALWQLGKTVWGFVKLMLQGMAEIFTRQTDATRGALGNFAAVVAALANIVTKALDWINRHPALVKWMGKLWLAGKLMKLVFGAGIIGSVVAAAKWLALVSILNQFGIKLGWITKLINLGLVGAVKHLGKQLWALVRHPLVLIAAAVVGLGYAIYKITTRGRRKTEEIPESAKLKETIEKRVKAGLPVKPELWIERATARVKEAEAEIIKITDMLEKLKTTEGHPAALAFSRGLMEGRLRQWRRRLAEAERSLEYWRQEEDKEMSAIIEKQLAGFEQIPNVLENIRKPLTRIAKTGAELGSLLEDIRGFYGAPMAVEEAKKEFALATGNAGLYSEATSRAYAIQTKLNAELREAYERHKDIQTVIASDEFQNLIEAMWEGETALYNLRKRNMEPVLDRQRELLEEQLKPQREQINILDSQQTYYDRIVDRLIDQYAPVEQVTVAIKLSQQIWQKKLAILYRMLPLTQQYSLQWWQIANDIAEAEQNLEDLDKKSKDYLKTLQDINTELRPIGQQLRETYEDTVVAIQESRIDAYAAQIEAVYGEITAEMAYQLAYLHQQITAQQLQLDQARLIAAQEKERAAYLKMQTASAKDLVQSAQDYADAVNTRLNLEQKIEQTKANFGIDLLKAETTVRLKQYEKEAKGWDIEKEFWGKERARAARFGAPMELEVVTETIATDKAHIQYLERMLSSGEKNIRQNEAWRETLKGAKQDMESLTVEAEDLKRAMQDAFLTGWEKYLNNLQEYAEVMGWSKEQINTITQAEMERLELVKATAWTRLQELAVAYDFNTTLLYQNSLYWDQVNAILQAETAQQRMRREMKQGLEADIASIFTQIINAPREVTGLLREAGVFAMQESFMKSLQKSPTGIFGGLMPGMGGVPAGLTPFPFGQEHRINAQLILHLYVNSPDEVNRAVTTAIKELFNEVQ